MEIDREIETLIRCEKLVCEMNTSYKAPAPGGHLNLRLVSPEIPEERFLLDIYEGMRSSSLTLKIATSRKTTMQTRRSSQPLVRVDIDDRAIHTNPDGCLVRGSHVHIASARYGTKLAFPLESNEGIMVVGKERDIPSIFEGFRRFCNIDASLMIEWGFGF